MHQPRLPSTALIAISVLRVFTWPLHGSSWPNVQIPASLTGVRGAGILGLGFIAGSHYVLRLSRGCGVCSEGWGGGAEC